MSRLDEPTIAEARAERRQIEERFPRPLATVSDLVDHIDHIVKVAGIDHVGIGSDFDGGGGLSDCRDVSEIWKITRELLRRGYSPDDIQKIWSGNFLRVWEANLR
jgi:membrane dipeptidase